MSLRSIPVYPTRPLRAVTYERNSVDPTRRGTSTADQRNENLRTCENNGWTHVEDFEDIDRSASRHAKGSRPRYDAMVEAIRRGEADVIVAWEASRAYRDTGVYQELKKLCEETGVLLCYGGQVYDMSKGTDRFVTGLTALQAEFESDAIRARILRTTQANAVSGRPHGRIPYGYRREYDPQTRRLIAQVIHEPEAAVVREMSARICAGETTYAIAKDFNHRGLKSPTGNGPWSAEMVKKILLKPTYIGKRQHRGDVIGDATWDPILEEAAYRTCERVLTNPARKTTRDNAVRWLLSGIVTCECGGVIRMRRNRHAPSYTCITSFCTSIRIDKLDAIVQAELLEYVERPEFAEALVVAADSGVQEALDEADSMERELLEARELVKARRLSVASLAELEQTFQPLIDAARERATDADVTPVLLRLAGRGARDVWAELDVPQRREAIRAVMTVRLNKAYSLGARYVTPDRYTITFLR